MDVLEGVLELLRMRLCEYGSKEGSEYSGDGRKVENI
jgi:hypothetical protein